MCLAGADRGGDAHVSKHQVLAWCAVWFQRRAGIQRYAAARGSCRPEVAAQREVPFGQSVEVLQRGTPRIVAQRPGKVRGVLAAGRHDRIVWHLVMVNWTHEKQI